LITKVTPTGGFVAPGNQKGSYFCGGSILKITLKCVILEAGLLII